MQLCGANSCGAKLAQDMPELISDEEDDDVPIPTFQTDQEWRQAIASFRGNYGACMLCVSSFFLSSLQSFVHIQNPSAKPQSNLHLALCKILLKCLAFLPHSQRSSVLSIHSIFPRLCSRF